ncbi:MAG: mercury methylation corrinoid protein HgcA [Bacteroidetes bacterium]|nr:mercury methylation corrinoid protein HgcA [Bacteroidota bacterium]
MKLSYISGYHDSLAGLVPQIACCWDFSDHLGTIKVRCNIGRDNYKVEPGIYAIGKPDKDSTVVVTANYKLTFDVVRRDLEGLDIWLMVLDTKGVNVWCAAGKGTFGTKELVSRIEKVQLEKIVSHHRLVVPQLGATGVSAHEVKIASGFTVIYGPVRSADLKGFITDGYKASKLMRTVTFTLRERARLITNDFMYGKYYLLAGMAGLFLLSGLYSRGLSLNLMLHRGIISAVNIFLAYFAGIVLAPLLLPWIPFRTFSMKGFVAGLLVAVPLTLLGLCGKSAFEIISWFLMICALSSFMMMNFTGSSTYTSLSGVQKEMKLALPFQISSGSFGLIIFIVSKFL